MEEIKKEFAVWNHGGIDELILVKGGYFASEQWLKTGNYAGIAGNKFGILGNDGMPGWVSKENIRPLSSMEEFEALKQKASIIFKRVLELKELGEEVVDALSVDYYRDFGKASCISEFIYFSSREGLKSTHIVYNDNQSGLPKSIIEDRLTSFSSYEEVKEAIISAVLEFQSRDFLDDVEKHFNKLKERGCCFIFKVA